MLDNLFWAADEDLKEVAISFSIEAVSFPFIPKGFKPDSSDNLNKEYQERHLNTEIASGGYNYGYVSQTSGNNGATGHEGRGWEYGDYNIYQKVYNTNICEQNLLRSCNGDFMLLSVVFTDPVPAEWACILPHTILKHSLYFHCGPFITDPVVDTISWLYDNTRGEMRRYPFINSTSSNSGNSQDMMDKSIDVAYRPTFNHYPENIPYVDQWEPNPYYYNSGITPPGGSINYYPSAELSSYCNSCPTYPVYYDMQSQNPTEGEFYNYHDDYPNAQFTSDYVHPPAYALLDAPFKLSSRLLRGI